MMKRITCTLLALFLFAEATALACVGSEKTEYVGRTITTIKAGSEGKSSTADDKVLVFEHKTDRLTIAYSKINGLEYGQKAGRRVAMSILVSPTALFSKKRQHFLTLNYMDESDRQQADTTDDSKKLVFTESATRLDYVWKAVAACDEPTPCNKKLTIREAIPRIIEWVTNSAWRAPGRQGKPDLNFDDFKALHKVYGNALGKLHSISEDTIDAEIWTSPIDSDQIIVGRYTLKSSYNPKDKISDVYVRLKEQEQYESKIPESVSVKEYAAILADQIDPQGTGITKEKFIGYMLKNQ